MFKIRLKQIKSFFWISLFSFFGIFIKKTSWVISERGKDARDNGYHFYKYLKTTHPEKKVYYIIDKKSADYHKVKDDAVQYGSLKNYWVVATAKKIISSHYALCLPDIGSKLFAICGLGKKFYFLQHGIIYNDLSFLYKKNAPMKLFCCGAKPEYEWVKSRFGHEDEVVQYTGLARYDALLTTQESKKQILVMPTWRKGIKDEASFFKSSFYEIWQNFLTNKTLNDLLKENGFKLIFYPHFELQKYLKSFSFDNDCVQLASFEEYDVQTLLKESALLITDYSSVFFDFAYMKKPLIYFQFDYEDFYSNHYQRGYFDYEEHGFGKVCADYDSVINEVIDRFENGVKIADTYASRIDNFFDMRDTNNCKRIYDAIEELR